MRWLWKYPVLCAWCKVVIGECEIQHSHGICAKCARQLLED